MKGFLGRAIYYHHDGGQGGGQPQGQQGNQGQGGGGQQPPPGQQPPAGQQQQQQGQQPDFRADFQRFVAARGQGDSDLAGYMLWQDNYQERERNRQLQGQVTQLQQELQQLRSSALNDEQRQAFQAYQQLGAPDQVRQHLAEYQRLQRNAQLAEVARAAGYNAEALQALDQLAGGLTYEIREAQVNGETVRQPFVRVKDANNVEQTIALQEYAQQRHAALIPALTAQNGQQQQAAGQQNQQSQGGQGARFVNQSPGGQGGGGSYVDRYLQQQQERRQSDRNPLMPEK